MWKYYRLSSEELVCVVIGAGCQLLALQRQQDCGQSSTARRVGAARLLTQSPQLCRLHEPRYGPMCKSPPAPSSLLVICKTTVVQMKPKESILSPSPLGNGSKPFRRSKDNGFTSSVKQPHKVISSKVPKDKLRVPVVSLEKIPNLVKADRPSLKLNFASKTDVTSSSASSSTASVSSLLKPAVVSKYMEPSPKKVGNGIGPTSTSTDKKHQNGPKGNSKPCKRRSERVFDPNKHCGVLDPETKKPCTRSLTCKTHSLSHRRAVPGRHKHFDILLAEHKAEHKAQSKEKEVTKDREHLQPMRETNQSLPSHPQGSSLAKPVNGFQEPIVTLPSKYRPVNGVPPRSSCANTLDIRSSASHAAQVSQPPVTSVGEDLASRLSSEEEDPDVAEDLEKLHCLFSRHHPRPIKICSFGSRLMGRGYFVFDRRWDRFRYALNSMVEKHLNSQMWKQKQERLDPGALADLLAGGRQPTQRAALGPVVSAPEKRAALLSSQVC
ncbi:hypothetical protein NDU88_001784 [Pleurodeles waltl]|uniref:SCA7 domain-containing protein n=1 Tax=Pleurodeles waltl TaxID=8319 RepID=A0AAV7SAP0_PLEWA|nr:hypothetical protein NDU88_001784 [Pleurodeles waltl]